MSHHDPGYPRAAAVSPRVQLRTRTGSTNADLVAAATADPADWPHLSVLLTTDQTAGRGRLDRTWTTPPGAALAVSVLVRIPGIPPAARGWVPLIAGAAMTRAARAAVGDATHAVAVKWPNDVLLDGLKVCGILAEGIASDLDAVVIGSGVNTRIAAADLPVPTATSFAVHGVDVDDDALLADYLTHLDRMLGALADARGDAVAAGVHAAVHDLCVTLGRAVTVTLPDGDTLRGTAVRLDAHGRLVIDAGGEVAVSAGDVVHVR